MRKQTNSWLSLAERKPEKATHCATMGIFLAHEPPARRTDHPSRDPGLRRWPTSPFTRYFHTPLVRADNPSSRDSRFVVKERRIACRHGSSVDRQERTRHPRAPKKETANHSSSRKRRNTLKVSYILASVVDGVGVVRLSTTSTLSSSPLHSGRCLSTTKSLRGTLPILLSHPPSASLPRSPHERILHQRTPNFLMQPHQPTTLRGQAQRLPRLNARSAAS